MSGSKKRGLGRGLSALMADVSDAEGVGAPEIASSDLSTLPIEQIKPNPDQPRKTFDPEELEELAASIRERGVIQPVIVRAVDDEYQLVAGERRWRAAQLAQLHEIPVVVRAYSDVEVLEIAIIENVQRADLNPIEEAQGYRLLMTRFDHTQEKLAEALGKSRSHIANILRLLQLPDAVITMVQSGDLSAGHARALITASNPLDLARQVVKQGLTVRATEKLAKTSDTASETKKQAGALAEKDADAKALESDLMGALGMRVSLSHKPGQEGGSLTLHYKSLEQLDELCRKLSSG